MRLEQQYGVEYHAHAVTTMTGHFHELNKSAMIRTLASTSTSSSNCWLMRIPYRFPNWYRLIATATIDKFWRLSLCLAQPCIPSLLYARPIDSILMCVERFDQMIFFVVVTTTGFGTFSLEILDSRRIRSFVSELTCSISWRHKLIIWHAPMQKYETQNSLDSTEMTSWC